MDAIIDELTDRLAEEGIDVLAYTCHCGETVIIGDVCACVPAEETEARTLLFYQAIRDVNHVAFAEAIGLPHVCLSVN